MVATTTASRGGADGLALELLGSPRLTRAGALVHRLERREAVLLALLALSGPTSRGHAARLLWPDSDARHAGNSLRQRLFRLKRAAGCEVVVGDALLALAPCIATDIGYFATRVAADVEFGSPELLGALDFGDCGELGDWVDAARERWRATRRQILVDLATRLETAGQIASALLFAQRLVAEDPATEHAHRRLMRLHYLRGDRAAALAAFEQCRGVLERDLGAGPGSETLQLARLVDSSEALPPPGVPARPPPVSLRRPPRLVGRDREWRLIEEAWGQGRVVLLSGDAGIGKSRLIGDLAIAHPGACASGARPGDANVPYALLARLLRQLARQFGLPAPRAPADELAHLLPELGPAPTTGLQTLRLHAAVDAAVRAWHGRGLGVLLIDDLQFADEASLDWLARWIAQSPDGTPHLLIAARGRDGPPGWRQPDGTAARDRVVDLALAVLDRGALAQLLASLAIPGIAEADWTEALVRHTGGNPMFVLETLIALQQSGSDWSRRAPAQLPLPDSVGMLIQQRLAQLSPDAARLARLAALAGPDFSVLLSARVQGVHPLDLSAAWGELQQAQVLRDGGFAHDLIAEATLRSVPVPIARQLHHEIATVGATLGMPAARVAGHWFEALQWARAGAAFMQAADVARAASQRKLEGELAGRAAECFEAAAEPQARFAACERQLSTARYCLRLDLQVEGARRLMQLASTPEQRGVALEAYAAALIEDFRHAEIVVAAGEARLIAAQCGDPSRELMAARTESRALGWLARHDEALQLVRRYLPRARERKDTSLGVRAVAEFGCTLMTCDRFDEAAALFDEALTAALGLEDWGLCQECHRHMAWVHDYRGDIANSVRSYEASESLAPRLGTEHLPAGISQSIFARRYKELGRYDKALELLEAVLVEQRGSPGVAVVAVTEADLAGLYLWLGQPARARAVLRAPSADAPPAMHRAFHFATAQIASWQGLPALASLQRALHWAAQEGGTFYRLAIECEMAQCLPPAAGAALALQALARSEALGLALTSWPLKAVACDALRRDGRLPEALPFARACVEFFADRPPFALYAPEYWWIAHQAFAAAGEARAAADAFDRAIDWIRTQALPHVPEPFRDSFVHRNPVNRQLRAAVRGQAAA